MSATASSPATPAWPPLPRSPRAASWEACGGHALLRTDTICSIVGADRRERGLGFLGETPGVQGWAFPGLLEGQAKRARSV